MENDSTPHEPAPAAAAAPFLAPEPQPSPQPSSSDDPAGDTAAARERIQEALSPAQKRAQAQTKKKYEFVNSMMTNLDVAVYAQLSIVYYMDCSFFRLLIRVLNQMVFLSPKPSFIPPFPQHRPYIGAIFGPNIICMLLHIFTARSEAGETMRGYLHGGIIIDLIGQKGPTSKIHLLLLDLLILVLQCFMLAVHVERERLSASLATFLKPSSDQPVVEIVSVQDQDAEERGVLRDEPTNARIIEQMESSLTSQSVGTVEATDPERARLLDGPPPREESTEVDNPLDIFWSGQAIVADFHIIDTLKKQWEDYGNATGSALQTVGFSAEFAAVTANRRFNAATQRLQRGVDSLGS